MNYMGHLCREVYEDAHLTQRQMAQHMGISLGKCNSLVKLAISKGYICQVPGGHSLTRTGRTYLEQFRVKNAVIVAAGIDVRFVPFAHELPKSLLRAAGERLIERTIRQLNERGIFDITVVVGYRAEKMEYLTGKFGVKLVFNADYATKDTLASLYLAREVIGATYLVNADFWMCENLFHEFEPESWIACHHDPGRTDEWCLAVDGKRRIRSMQHGGWDMLVKRGPVYIDAPTGTALQPVLERAFAQPGLAVQRWENTLQRHLDVLELYANIQPAGVVRDFDSVEEIRAFAAAGKADDMDMALDAIACMFAVNREEVEDIHWLVTSVANRVFRFTVAGKKYVCCLPGAAPLRITSYKQEAAVHKALLGQAVTDEVLHYDVETGTKVAQYYPIAKLVCGENVESLRAVAGLLQRLHGSGAHVRHHFSVEQVLRKYDVLCRRERCIHFEDYEDTLAKAEKALALLRGAAGEEVLCHINAEIFDYVADEQGLLRMANWQYSGMCHPFADVAMAALQFNLPPQQLHTLLGWYLGQAPQPGQLRLCSAFAAAGGLLWSLFAEYCQHGGDNLGEYAVQMYQLCKQYLAALDG